MDLIVYEDAFEVSNPFPPGRWFGQEYSYRAADTTIQVVPGLLRWYIEIDARPQPGRQPPVRIARISIGHKGQLREIWYVLIRAGATPIGPPPTISD